MNLTPYFDAASSISSSGFSGSVTWRKIDPDLDVVVHRSPGTPIDNSIFFCTAVGEISPANLHCKPLGNLAQSRKYGFDLGNGEYRLVLRAPRIPRQITRFNDGVEALRALQIPVRQGRILRSVFRRGPGGYDMTFVKPLLKPGTTKTQRLPIWLPDGRRMRACEADRVLPHAFAIVKFYFYHRFLRSSRTDTFEAVVESIRILREGDGVSLFESSTVM